MVTTVIYDMDGTLVDSERLSLIAWKRSIEEFGSPFPTSVVETFIGRNRADILAIVAEQTGSEELALKIYDRHIDFFVDLCETDLELKPGAVESLNALREAGLRVGLATSAGRDRVGGRLGRFGLEDGFDAITCGDEVSHSKPEPDIFLEAARRLGAEPAACVVVEDSFNGVRAGRAAGMHVFMVPDILQPTEEIAGLCDAVLPSLNELPAAVAAIR